MRAWHSSASWGVDQPVWVGCQRRTDTACPRDRPHVSIPSLNSGYAVRRHFGYLGSSDSFIELTQPVASAARSAQYDCSSCERKMRSLRRISALPVYDLSEDNSVYQPEPVFAFAPARFIYSGSEAKATRSGVWMKPITGNLSTRLRPPGVSDRTARPPRSPGVANLCI